MIDINPSIKTPAKARFDTHGGCEKLNGRTGSIVDVLRPLTEVEADLFDVGPMYKIRFVDGVESDAFEDELTECERSSCFMTKTEFRKYEDAVDIVCMNCGMDTLEDETICDRCPVRKTMDYIRWCLAE